MQLAIRPAGVPRPMLFFVAAALLAVALAGVLLVAGSRRPTPPPFGPAGNGAILTGIGTSCGWPVPTERTHTGWRSAWARPCRRCSRRTAHGSRS